MDHIDNGFYMVHGSVLEDAVPEIENMPRTTVSPAQNIKRPLADHR